jgi:hypothetical protein
LPLHLREGNSYESSHADARQLPVAKAFSPSRILRRPFSLPIDPTNPTDYRNRGASDAQRFGMFFPAVPQIALAFAALNVTPAVIDGEVATL